MFKLNPLTIEQLKRFKSIKRGYYSFLILCFLILFSLLGELFVNNRALIVYYNKKFYFPTYTNMIPGTVFGLGYEYETNYRELQKIFKQDSQGNFVIMPLVPYDPFETDKLDGSYPPFPPSIEKKHYLGTDKTGRDVLARLLYGFRIAIFFSLLLLIFEYAIGITIGLLMGYLGGRFDLFFQRIIEIWNNIPFLYAIIIIASIVIPNFFSLLLLILPTPHGESHKVSGINECQRNGSTSFIVMGATLVRPLSDTGNFNWPLLISSTAFLYAGLFWSTPVSQCQFS